MPLATNPDPVEMKKAEMRVARLTSIFRPAQQLARIFREQVGEASEILLAPQSADSIHVARILMKRVRTALRLVRAAIGEHAFTREDATVGKAAHALGELRNNEVLLRICEQLHERSKRKRVKSALEQVLDLLSEANHISGVRRKTAVAQSRRFLDQAASDSDDWRMAEQFSVPESIATLYKRARASFHKAVQAPRRRNLHLLRQRTQYLRFAMDMVTMHPPAEDSAFREHLLHLADQLGAEHDLTMLLRFVAEKSGKLPRRAMRMAVKTIRRRRARLRERSLGIAAHCYARKPSSVTARLQSLWQQWENSVVGPADFN